MLWDSAKLTLVLHGVLHLNRSGPFVALEPLCETEMFPSEEWPVGARPALFSQRLQSLGQFKVKAVCMTSC